MKLQDRFDQAGDEGWLWTWDRSLWSRARSELEDLSRLLLPIMLKRESTDKWVWDLDTNGIFSVKKLRELLDDRLLVVHIGVGVTCWNPLVQKKKSTSSYAGCVGVGYRLRMSFMKGVMT